MIWDPFDPISYFAHILIGGGGLLAGVVALFATKGQRLHVRAGWFFMIGMTVASLTVFIFTFTRVVGLGVVFAILTLYMMVTSWLTFRRPQGGGKVWLIPLTVLPSGLFLFVTVQMTRGALGEAPATLIAGQLLLLTVLGSFVWSDLKLIRGVRLTRVDQLRRHLTRMIMGMSLATAAALFTNFLDLRAPPFLLVGGPLLAGVLLSTVFWIRADRYV